MQNGIHFISGMPRSGSTLLAALLLQNPRFHAGVTSAVAPLYEATHTVLSAGGEFFSTVTDAQRLAVFRGLFEAYYMEFQATKVIFDTNRDWCSRIWALDKLFPEAKMLCCVRSTAWILDSLERMAQANPLQAHLIYQFKSNMNTYTRAEQVMRYNGLVGRAYAGLKEACCGDLRAKVLLIEYESLTTRPREVLELVYDFIGEEYFEHNFDKVAFDAPEFDKHLGMPGLHRVDGSVHYSPRSTILPRDLFSRYDDQGYWATLAKEKIGLRLI